MPANYNECLQTHLFLLFFSFDLCTHSHLIGILCKISFFPFGSLNIVLSISLNRFFFFGSYINTHSFRFFVFVPKFNFDAFDLATQSSELISFKTILEFFDCWRQYSLPFNDTSIFFCWSAVWCVFLTHC